MASEGCPGQVTLGWVLWARTGGATARGRQDPPRGRFEGEKEKPKVAREKTTVVAKASCGIEVLVLWWGVANYFRIGFV